MLFVFLNILATFSGLAMIPTVYSLTSSIDSIANIMLVQAGTNEPKRKLAEIARAASGPAWVFYSSFVMSAASTIAIGSWWLKMHRHDK